MKVEVGQEAYENGSSMSRDAISAYPNFYFNVLMYVLQHKI